MVSTPSDKLVHTDPPSLRLNWVQMGLDVGEYQSGWVHPVRGRTGEGAAAAGPVAAPNQE